MVSTGVDLRQPGWQSGEYRSRRPPATRRCFGEAGERPAESIHQRAVDNAGRPELRRRQVGRSGAHQPTAGSGTARICRSRLLRLGPDPQPGGAPDTGAAGQRQPDRGQHRPHRLAALGPATCQPVDLLGERPHPQMAPAPSDRSMRPQSAWGPARVVVQVQGIWGDG